MLKENPAASKRLRCSPRVSFISAQPLYSRLSKETARWCVPCRDVSPDVKRRLAELESRLETSMKELGRAYGSLVVGTDMEDCHHMNCGR